MDTDLVRLCAKFATTITAATLQNEKSCWVYDDVTACRDETAVRESGKPRFYDINQSRIRH